MTVFHKQKTHDILTLSCIYCSGKSGKGNIKNPKKSQHGQASKSSKDDYHIPKKNNLLQADSDDDKIGQSSASTQSSTNKFVCNASGLVKSYCHLSCRHLATISVNLGTPLLRVEIVP